MAKMAFLPTLCVAIAIFQSLVLAAPAAQSADNGIGDILNLLGLGFVTQINTLITVGASSGSDLESTHPAHLSIVG